MATNNDQVDFALRLVDDMSKPAQEAKKALKSVKKELGSVEAAEKKANEAAKEHADAMKRVGEASGKASSDLVSFAIAAGAAVAATAAAMVVAAEKWAIEASDFQTKSLAALEAIDGIGVNAKATLDELRTAANAAGLPTERLTKFYQELRLAGFEVERVQDIVAAGLDVSAVLGDDKGNAFIEAMKDIRSKGKLEAGMLDALKGAGLGDSDEFFQVLAAMQGSATFGKTKAEIEKLLQDGKVDAETGTKAILEIVSDKIDKGGPLGTIAKQLGEGTVSGQLQALKNQMNSVFADSAVTGPFIDALKTINKLLDPTTESGQKIRATLGRAFQSIADALAQITPEQIERLLNATIGLVESVLDLAAAFSGSLSKAMAKVLAPFDQLTDGSESSAIALQAIGAAAEWLAEALGTVAGSILSSFLALPSRLVSLYQGFKDVFDSIPGSWEELQEWFDSIDLWEVGSNIIDGLWEGIKDGWRWLIESIEGLLDLLPAAAKKALGIASPSKVFAEIGEYTVEGFTGGVNDNAGEAQEAVEQLVDPPAAPALEFNVPVAGAPGAALGGRGGVTIENLSISLQVAGGDVSDASAARFAREFAREFQKTIQGLAVEAGEDAA